MSTSFPASSGQDATRMGVMPGMIVMEIGYDNDVDDGLRAAFEDATGEGLVDEDSDEVVDVVLLWHRSDDGDLADALVDAIGPLADHGVIWLMTPSAGAPTTSSRPRSRRPRRSPGCRRRRWPQSSSGVDRSSAGGSPLRQRPAMTAVGLDATVAVGDEAPDFALNDQNNERFRLSSFHGSKAVLLVFYPLAFTGICTGELSALRDDLDAFQNDDVQVAAISVDSVYTQQGVRRARGLRVPAAVGLLAARRSRPALRRVQRPESGIANRGTFLVDRIGIVRFAEMLPPGRGARPAGVAGRDQGTLSPLQVRFGEPGRTGLPAERPATPRPTAAPASLGQPAARHCQRCRHCLPRALPAGRWRVGRRGPAAPNEP